MGDETCFVCFVGPIVIGTLIWFAVAIGQARRKAEQALASRGDDELNAARMRDLYGAIARLERRVADLEAARAWYAHSLTPAEEAYLRRGPLATPAEEARFRSGALPAPVETAPATAPTGETAPPLEAARSARDHAVFMRPEDREALGLEVHREEGEREPAQTSEAAFGALAEHAAAAPTEPAPSSAAFGASGESSASPSPAFGASGAAAPASPYGAPAGSFGAPASPYGAPASPYAAPTPPSSGSGGFGVPPGAPPPAAPEPPPSPAISWEQWLGVRGAAAAGAVVLAIAAVYFFRYSMEHGLISPAARVVIGTLLGLGCIGASELRLRRTHAVLGEYLAGAGFVILYLAFWAARARYHLIPMPAATVLLIAVTAASCTFAYVRSAIPVATLGMLGGFATPLLLSTGEDRPVSLFSYLLMLDGALLLLARRRSWGWLAIASLVGTFLYQFAWFSARLDPPRMWLGVAIVVAFAVLFAAFAPRGAQASEWRGMRIASVLLPAMFALLFASTPRLSHELVPTAVLLVLVTAGGAYLTRMDRMAWLGPATASAAVATLAVLVLGRTETPTLAWQSDATLLALMLVQIASAELERRRPVGLESLALLGFDVVLAGGFALELFGAARPNDYHPPIHLAMLGTLVVLATIESLRGNRFARMLGVGIALASTLASIHVRHADDIGFPAESVFLAMIVASAMLVQVAPILGARRDADAVRLADHGAGFVAAFSLFHLALVPFSVPLRPVPYFGATIVLLLLATLVATRRGHGGWWLAAVAVTFVTHAVQEGRTDREQASTVAMFVGLGLVSALVALSPRIVGSRARAHVATWRAASLAGPSVLGPALFRYSHDVDDSSRGLVPLVLSLFGLATVALARRSLPTNPDTRKSAFAWSAVASLSLVSIAIPVQLRNEWVTVGWAIQGAAVIALWKRLDHAGIKYYAAGLFGLAFTRLVLNPEVLRYHAPSGVPILNWLAYTYLVPVAAFLVAARILRDLEVPRYREPERAAFPKDVPVLAAALALASVIVGFAWVNLAVIDAFAVGRTLELPVERLPARDLSMSLAWALYGVVLLAIGVWRGVAALRKTSLVIVLITCSKVFLYDLGNLHDLYRVASLLGLAVALIGVSLAYKRFVFRDLPETR